MITDGGEPRPVKSPCRPRCHPAGGLAQAHEIGQYALAKATSTPGLGVAQNVPTVRFFLQAVNFMELMKGFEPPTG